MATATKIKAPTIKSLLAALKKESLPKYHAALKTAIETGWFTDYKVLTKLTEDEHKELKELHGKDKDVKNSKVLPVVDLIPPTGGVLDFVEELGESASLPALAEMETAMGKKLYLRADYYQFLIKRHPKAQFFLTTEETAEHKKTGSLANAKVIMSERSTVAMVTSFSRV